jgi:hypothetical protein
MAVTAHDLGPVAGTIISKAQVLMRGGWNGEQDYWFGWSEWRLVCA